MFDQYIGIDYSGAATPESRLTGLQVYSSNPGSLPQRLTTMMSRDGKNRNWSRKQIASWLIELFQDSKRSLVGIDHAFSFPNSYFERNNLKNWNEFLADFCKHWPTHESHRTVESLRDKNEREGQPEEMRLTDNWTSSAKSVFNFFKGPGQVAKSTHAGIPWLKQIRDATGDTVHFWPFDGWEIPEGKNAIVEIYPSIFKRRYSRDERTPDEQDAYSVSRWLNESDARGILGRYLNPPLTDEELTLAKCEGWILGIS